MPRQHRICVKRALSRAVVFVALSLPIAAESQETMSSLQGVVRNESGHPIEQAQVLLNAGQAPRELRTDRDGGFRFIGVPTGPTRVRVLRIGFQPHDTTVTVTGASTVVEIQLRGRSAPTR